MKVLHVLDSLRLGGSESLAATLATAFEQIGVGNVVCGLGEDGDLRQRLEAAGIEVLCLRRPLGIRLDAMFGIGKIAMSRGCDAILTHHFRQLVHTLPGATLLRKKLVHVEHDSHSYQNRPDIIRKFSLLMPFIHRFICASSEDVAEWYYKNVPTAKTKLRSIVNCVDTNYFRFDESVRKDIRQKLGIGTEDYVVGTCARLEPVKDIGLLIQGFRELQNRLNVSGKRAYLVIVGSGSLMEFLKIEAARAGVESQSIFAGAVNDVPRWLNGFDVYAITSFNEGLPLSVLEAMSCEIPVVGVDVGSVSRVVDSAVGALIRIRNPKELGKRLAELAESPERCRMLGIAGRERIIAGYSIEVMVNNYLAALGVEPNRNSHPN